MARQTIQNSNASLYLDGNAGYFTVPITPDPTGFSFGMWIKTGKRTLSSSSIYMSSTSAAFTDGFILNRVVGRGDIEFIGYNTTNSINTSLRTGQVSDGQWTHIVVTYLPSGVCRMYQNGVLVNTVTATNTITTGTTSVYVGRRSYTAAFAGLNASQLVWHNTTTPWTAQQVLDLYNKGTIPTGATAVYPLSEGAGTVAYDTSGNGNNGTITSGTWTRDTPTKTRKLVNNNLVYNGDFEIAPVVNVAQTGNYTWINGTSTGTSSTAEPIFGWFKYSYGGTQSAMIDTTELLNGKPSLKLSTTATNSYVGMSINSLDATYHKWNNIPCLPSTSYTASVWIKTSVTSGTATTGVRANISQLTGTGINSAGAGLTLVTGLVANTGWTKYEGTFTTSSTARFFTPEMRVVGNDGTATLIADAWFADIQLYPTTPVTRNVATGRLTATGRSAA